MVFLEWNILLYSMQHGGVRSSRVPSSQQYIINIISPDVQITSPGHHNLAADAACNSHIPRAFLLYYNTVPGTIHNIALYIRAPRAIIECEIVWC